MIGKVHELVDKIWLIQVASQWAELFVSGQAVAARNKGRRNAEEMDRFYDWANPNPKQNSSSIIPNLLTHQGFSPNSLLEKPLYFLQQRASLCKHTQIRF